jgi:opacity protein-like surface antigen
LVALPASSAAQDAPRVEVSAGWRLLISLEELIREFDGAFPAGWYGDIAINVTDTIAVVGDVAGVYKTFDESTARTFGLNPDVTADVRLHTLMGGVRVSNRQNPRVVPFAQVLFGVARGSVSIEGTTTVFGRPAVVNLSEQSPSKFAFDVGAGVNLNVTDAVGIRISGSYIRPRERLFRPIAAEAGGSGVRFGAGVVVPF